MTQYTYTEKIGKVYVIEGCDGVGKTTIAARVAEETGFILFNDPNSELPIAKEMRRWLKTIDGMPATYMLAAVIVARADLIMNSIWPVLRTGQNVILDRFWPSTWAYQSFESSELIRSFIKRNIHETGVPIERIFVLHDEFEVIKSRIGDNRDVMESTARIEHVYNVYKEMASSIDIFGVPSMAVHSGDIENAVATILKGIH